MAFFKKYNVGKSNDIIQQYSNETNSYIYFMAMHPSGPDKQTFEYPTARFYGYVSDFDESFASSWDAQQYYGKTDAFVGFKNTKRTMSLSWKTPAGDIAQAQENYENLNTLATMLYPSYITGLSRVIGETAALSEKRLAALISNNLADPLHQVYNQPASLPLGKPPTIGVSWGNLISQRDPAINAHDISPSHPNQPLKREQSLLRTARSSALFCHVENFTMSPEVEAGHFALQDLGLLFPKVWSCSVALTITHTHELGRQTTPW